MKGILVFVTALIVSVNFINAQDITSQNDMEAVSATMKSYKEALQNLTMEGTLDLFTKDSKVYESGGVEGSYPHYVEHHLGPELGHFKSFTFSDYQIDIQIDVPYAFTTETYTIELKAKDGEEPRTISKKGVATSILKETDGMWKIAKTHTSSS